MESLQGQAGAYHEEQEAAPGAEDQRLVRARS